MQWITARGVLERLWYKPKFPVLEIGTSIKDYSSFDTLTKDLGTGNEFYLMYDIEAGKLWPTPVNEQEAPVRYMQLFSQLGHSLGKRVMCAPGLDLANAIPGGNTWPDNETWYMKVRIPWHAARYADALQVQSQSLIPKGQAAFYDLISKSVRQAREANPYCVTGAGLSTKRGTISQNVDCFSYTVGRTAVKRWWLNVPGPNQDYPAASAIMQKCENIAVHLGL